MQDHVWSNCDLLKTQMSIFSYNVVTTLRERSSPHYVFHAQLTEVVTTHVLDWGVKYFLADAT